jgi:reprolysin-like metallo-peptidase family M12B
LRRNVRRQRKKALTAALLAMVPAAVIAACRPADPSISTPMARTPWGTEVHWSRDAIDLEPVRPPPSSGVTGTDLVRALEDEARAWNGALSRCGVPPIHIGVLRDDGVARDDGHNRVVVKAGLWCPDDGGEDADCYDPTRQAKTWLRPRRDSGPRDGEIREADIEINAVNFRWSLNGDRPGTRNLHAIVGHELGHVLGLDHACAHAGQAGDGGQTKGCDAHGALRSIMEPDPTEPDRPVVLEPTPDAVERLCQASGNQRRP